MTTPTTNSTIANEPSQQEKAEYARRVIEMADRSYLSDRLTVALPDHLHGEWIGVDDFSQYNAQVAGFEPCPEEYLNETNHLHHQADGKSSVGDVRFMVVPKWKYDILQEAKRVEAARRSGTDAAYAESLQEDFQNSYGLSELKQDRDGTPLKTTGRVVELSEKDITTIQQKAKQLQAAPSNIENTE